MVTEGERKAAHSVRLFLFTFDKWLEVIRDPHPPPQPHPEATLTNRKANCASEHKGSLSVEARRTVTHGLIELDKERAVLLCACQEPERESATHTHPPLILPSPLCLSVLLTPLFFFLSLLLSPSFSSVPWGLRRIFSLPTRAIGRYHAPPDVL